MTAPKPASLEEVKKMSDEELKLEVAKLHGWHDFKWSQLRPEILLAKFRDQGVGVPPDYPHDLNACHEIERLLFLNENTLKKMWIRYCGALRELTQLPEHATARRRCEALVLTLSDKSL